MLTKLVETHEIKIYPIELESARLFALKCQIKYY